MRESSLLLLFVFSFIFLQAQQNLGIWNSNYAGIGGVGLNPSSIADSKLKWDLNVFSGNVVYDNTYVYIPRDSLKFFGFKNIIDDIINQKQFSTYYHPDNPNELFDLTLSNDFRGPSLMLQIGKKSELGFTTGVRFYANIDNITGNFAQNSFVYLLDQPLWKTTFHDNTARLNSMAWLEYGITYATVFYNKGKSKLKGGITVNYLQGIGAAYFNNTNLTYNIIDTSHLIFTNSSIDYGRTDLNALQNANSFGDFINGNGASANIGFTYVHLRDSSEYNYRMDCKYLPDPDKSNYLYRIGLSLLDAGAIKFHKNTAAYSLHTDSADFTDWYHSKFTSNVQFDRSLSAVFYHGDSSQSFVADHFTMNLPLAVSLQGDVNVYKNFFLNATIVKGFSHGSNLGVVRPDIYSLTPRFEMKWFEVSVPFSMIYYNHWQQRIGLAVRIGYFFIGGDAPGSLLKLNDMEGADFYAGAHIFIPQKKLKDRDNDNVSDKLDRCLDEKGSCETHGCPDKDLDGVIDKLDECADQAGPTYLKGCPDRDNDSIPDKDDHCPDLKGLKAFQGCPDTDDDGIIDAEDSCPVVKGLAQHHGCPDSDGDGIPDNRDECPDSAGNIKTSGCPDRDGDGVRDNKDKCPDVIGLPEFDGCAAAPHPDILNEILVSSRKILFPINSSTAEKSLYQVMDHIADLMKQYPKTKWRIVGYTDITGSNQHNLELSMHRAGFVRDYLVKKGVSAENLSIHGMGSADPVEKNKTAVERAKNRRVEISEQK